MFIAMYDENDCIVEIFENKKLNKNDGKWYKLYCYRKETLEEVK